MSQEQFSPEHLEWAEKSAIENLRGRLATGDMLLTQANQLLALLLAGMAGALAYGAKVFQQGAGPLEWGAATIAAWLAAAAITLTHKCIATRVTQMLFNEPKNLLQPGYALPQMRAFELENLQARIEATKARNSNVAWWLDRCRYAAALTPAVFALGAGLGV